jgi:DNA helicase-2/ATP-dependent DNA helicase PcrA
MSGRSLALEHATAGDGAPGVLPSGRAALDPEQQQAVLAPLGPVCILAGAGTGKTRTITHRIEHLVHAMGVPAGHILAVTFTTRAAGELRGRLRSLGVEGVQARTFHAAALRQLGYFWPKVAGAALPRLVESKIGLVARAAGRLHLQPDRTELRDLTSEVEWAKATLVAPEGYPAAAAAGGRQATQPPDVVARLYATYEQTKREAGVLDFDDLLLLTAAIIEEHSWVATELRSRYRHFVVDEYQDVNPLQQRVLDAWLGDRDSLCVVGDANQTIYSFTGATPRYLLDFPRRFPDAALVRLVRDYRSTPQVVGLANALLARSDAGAAATPSHQPLRAGDTGPSAAGGLRPPHQPLRGSAGGRRAPRGAAGQLVAQLPDGPDPVWVEADSEPEEASAVTKRIQALLRSGVSASDVAILYRINAQSEVYEAALGAAGVPYLVHGGERFFDRPEVKDAVRLLRASARSADPDSPPGLADRVADVLGATGWRPGQPPAGSGAERERWENLAALWRLAGAAHDADPAASLDAFLADLADRAAHQHIPTVEGVTLSSLHAAKGLEWDAVFIVGLVDGTLPIVHAQTAEQVEEERRLLYVGITRARSHLTLSWALARSEGGRRSRRPSRFMDGLRPSGKGPSGLGKGSSGLRSPGKGGPGSGGSGGPGGSRATTADGGAGRRSRTAVRCRVCGTALTGAPARLGRCESCPGDVDAALYERLRAWRVARAKEQSVPGYVVFTDATLVAIAESRPRSVAELVAIPGIGQAKLDRYGDDVLDVVAGKDPGSSSSS